MQTEKLFCQVPYINQMPKWPTGCESVSTVMALQYLGCHITVDEFIGYLPARPLTLRNGTLYGADPDCCFIGTPYDDKSYGCYAKVIVNTVNRFAAEKDLALQAKEVSALSLQELTRQYLAAGCPIIFWATIDLLPSYRQDSWLLYDTGERFTWISNEHCMLLVGADEQHYIFNDPWNGNGIIAYPKQIVEERHREMRSMAVVIEKAKKQKG